MGLFDRFKKKKPQEIERVMLKIRMQDGTIEEYPETFQITDGINCVICSGETYHTNLDCPSLKMERDIKTREIKGMYIKDAERQGISYCWRCKEFDEDED